MSTSPGRRICLICGAPTNYAHFGIDSCRACAEFYKRTVTTKKNYACRQGNLKCTTNKGERFVCRRCRFDKCRDLGMTLDDPRRRRRMEDEEERGTDEESISPSTSADLHSASPQESILDRICREHRRNLEESAVFSAAIARRKHEEMAIRPTSLRQHVRVPHETEDIMLSSWSFLMECVQLYAADYFFLGSACFPEFEQLTLEEKLVLLQSCAVRIFLHEALFNTTRVFGQMEGPIRKLMLTLTTCLDRDNIKFLIQDSNPSARHDDIIRSVTYYMDKLERIAWPVLGSIQLTDTEFHALFGLVVWQFDPSNQLPNRLIEIAEKIRRDIFADLCRYYSNVLKLDDYSVRMGNLMTLEHILQEANSLMAEEMMQTYNLLDMLQADASFLQAVLQIKL